MSDRLFRLEDANAVLPDAALLLGEIQTAKAELEELSDGLERLMIANAGNGHVGEDIADSRRLTQEAARELDRLLSELETTGAELKSIDDGLLDFPSDRNGRIVYLCWRLGETKIAFWHDLDTGFAGRKPL